MVLRGEAHLSRPAEPDGSRRLGSGVGVFSPEPARALATGSGGFDNTDSESESNFEDISSSDDEDESRGWHGDEMERFAGRASRDSDRREESFSVRVAEALREMRFQRNTVATEEEAKGVFSFPAGRTPPAAGESRRLFRRVRATQATPSALFMLDLSSGRRLRNATA